MRASIIKKKSLLPTLFVALLVLFATVLMQPVNASGDFWVKRTPMPTASAYVGAVTVNGEIHVITPNSHYLYDPPTDTWTTKTPMPTVRIGFAIATYQNMIYVFGGCSGFNQVSGYPINCTGANEVYNPATDSWENRAPMPTARAELQANEVNGKIYLIGGTLPSGNVSNATEVYSSSSDSWSTTAPIPTAVGLYASAVVDNKIYIEGGGQSGPSIGDLNQIYNPETNVWTLGEPLPAPLAVWAAAGATSGVFAPSRLYVIGGTTDGINGTNINQIYDPQANRWTTGASMTTPRGALAVTVANDTLYAIGGTDNFLNPEASTRAENEQYFPLGYAGPAPSLSPSASQSPSPTRSPSSSPSQSASPSPTSPAEYITAAVATIVIILVVAAFTIRKRSKKNR
jgi:N-acetylneuraminic acid mutarotase